MPRLKKQWFLVGLMIALLAGSFFSNQLLPVLGIREFRYGVVAVVLFLMSLPLSATDVGQTLRKPWPALLATFFNIVALPLFAWPFAFLLNDHYATGLFIAVSVPCTMASAAVWTRRAGGNYAVAILVTMITNLFCFLFTPFWILMFTGQDAQAGADNQLSFWNMLYKLALIVVLPMVLGQVVRRLGSVGSWATQKRVELGVFAQLGILIMVASGAAENARKLQESGDELFRMTEFLAMLVAVNLVHIGILFAGMRTARLAKMSRADQIAVAFAGSQKTLMVGIALATDLHASILPMLAFHICQLFVDTLIADRLARKDKSKE